MLKEFKDFIAKGNVLDLAVAVIIGAAFGAVITSFVKDVISPIIGMAGKANFDNMFIVLREGATPGPYTTPAEAAKAGANTLNYGSFITILINFLVVSFVIFLIVKSVNHMKKPAPVVEEAPAEPTKEEVLLTEIRDILKSK